MNYQETSKCTLLQQGVISENASWHYKKYPKMWVWYVYGIQKWMDLTIVEYRMVLLNFAFFIFNNRSRHEKKIG